LAAQPKFFASKATKVERVKFVGRLRPFVKLIIIRMVIRVIREIRG